MKTFQNNGKNITENIIKLKLDHLFNLCCIATWSTYVQRKQIFDNFMITYDKLTLAQFTVKGHNWVSLTYCDFNSYLVITRFIHEERLGVCDHEITPLTIFYETFLNFQL